MSIIKEYFYNIQCDRCGKLANDEYWDVDAASAKESADESSFVKVGEKHYCPECYTIDDNDNIVVKEEKKAE